MSKTVVILQSSYIPWKGYFDLVNAADVFVLYDEVQYTRRDWRNRNKIIVDGVPKWLTIPVESKGRYEAAITDMQVADDKWADKHLNTIRHAYRKAPFFADFFPRIEDAYRDAARMSQLYAVNRLFIERLSRMIGAETVFAVSQDTPRTTSDPTRRLAEICTAHGATMYLSGPAAKAYLDPAVFDDAGIDLRYCDYTGYPAYEQASGTFEHGVSVIDLLLRVGPEAKTHLKSHTGKAALFGE